MSIIGLYDYNFMKYERVIPNLELLKLHSFYTAHHHIVVMPPTLDTGKYTKTFIFKDYEDGIYEDYFFEPNVVLLGKTITPDKYAPMDLAIERSLPNWEIFDKYKSHFGLKKVDRKNWQTITNAAHCRLSLDGRTIWDAAEEYINAQLKIGNAGIILHDYNLGEVKEAPLFLKDNTKRIFSTGLERPFGVGNKFPIQVSCTEDLMNWLSLRPMPGFLNLQYNGIMEDEALVEFCERAKNFNLELIYNVAPAWYSENQFLEQYLEKFLKQALYLHSSCIKISLIYDDNFLARDEIKNLIRLLNLYISHGYQSRNNQIEMENGTLYRFCRALKTPPPYKKEVKKTLVTLEEARAAFAFIREYNYDLFKMFYNWRRVKYEKGEFKPYD